MPQGCSTLRRIVSAGRVIQPNPFAHFQTFTSEPGESKVQGGRRFICRCGQRQLLLPAKPARQRNETASSVNDLMQFGDGNKSLRRLRRETTQPAVTAAFRRSDIRG